jgi:triosephosphate isomerase
MAARKPLIAGNWKMYGRAASLAEIAALEGAIGAAGARLDVLICPPAPYLQAAVSQARGTSIQVGAQDCSAGAEDAARTGEVNAAMLADAGARYVIVGHSERRSQHGESDALVRKKAEAAMAAGLIPIVCVGETQAERAGGTVADVISTQVRNSMPGEGVGFVIAYEPVWCIGGDRTPSMEEIGEVHAVIRQTLAGRIGGAADGVRTLYGGAVNPKNAAEIFAVDGVDGALVGRASLKAADFSAIILAHPAAT